MEDWYSPMPPISVEPGSFDIWIVGSEKNQLSGCAYEIRHARTGVILESSEPLITERDVSSQWRAHLAAVVRAVERLPNGSHATLCSYNKSLLTLVDGLDQYRTAGWRKSNNKLLSDLEIVLRLFRARDGDYDRPRNIRLETRPPKTATDAAIINRLREKVVNLLDVKTRKGRSVA